MYSDAKDKISATKEGIAIITAVESIAFVIICILPSLFFYYVFTKIAFDLTLDLIIFRPFVKQLRVENDHTFSLIRMIPRNLLTNVPEIQEFINNTLNEDEDDE